MFKKKPPMYYPMIILMFLSVSCFIVSYLIQEKCVWVSNILISVAGGFVTGIVLYIFTNIRNSIREKSKSEYERLICIRNRVHRLGADTRYFQTYHSLYVEDVDYDIFFRRTIENAYDIFEELFELPDDIFAELNIDVENTDLLDLDTIENAYRSIEDIEDEVGLQQLDALLMQLSDKMVQIEMKIRQPIKERKNKLILLNDYPL